MKSSKIRSASTLKSVALFTMILFAASFIISCASGRGEHASTQAASNDELPDELSLKADRSALEEERKDIPEERRRENDELAALLQMIQAKPNQEPSEIRDRFSKAVRDRREKSDKRLRKLREDFSKNERRAREAFLKSVKEERDAYMGSKHSPEERKDFFGKQEDTRRDFFANQSEKRHDFESKMTEDRKAFEDYIKEKTSQFNDEIRAYSASFYDRKKQERLAKETKEKARAKASMPSPRSGQADERDEFETIPQGPSIPLGPPSDEK
jgi:hypothetical protein